MLKTYLVVKEDADLGISRLRRAGKELNIARDAVVLKSELSFQEVKEILTDGDHTSTVFLFEVKDNFAKITKGDSFDAFMS